MLHNSHPWRAPRGVGTIDPVASTRSSQFAAYLERIPREERRQIEAAERAFVKRVNTFTSPQQSAVRDFAAGMIGLRDNPNYEERSL